MWTYKGVDIFRAGPNCSGIRWSAYTTTPGRRPWQPATPPRLLADTKQGMRDLITHYQQ